MKKERVALLSVGLGCWQIALPLTLSYQGCPVGLSDIATGLLFILLGLLSIDPQRSWSRWAIGLLGVWLQMAPLIFWAPAPFMYVNDVLIGTLAIVFSFFLSHSTEAKEAANTSNTPCIPTGWSYNPSSWSHRIPTVFIALLCWFFSRYMAAYQLGYIDHIWDPFFTEGTLQVITSKISKGFPISDAGMGAVCYTLEALLGWQGDTRRWATMPWLVTIFGFLVIPVGAVSVTLIILQPVAVGAWCSWCLATALGMLAMIVLTGGELAAVFQLLWETKQKGRSVWQVFWKGVKGAKISSPLPQKNLKKSTPYPLRGVTFPWTLGLSFLLGLWLMASPSLLKLESPLSTANYILGPLVAACSFISLAEVFRGVRYLNFLFSILLILAPWITSSTGAWGVTNNLIVGCFVAVFCLQKGRISEEYGQWQRFIF